MLEGRKLTEEEKNDDEFLEDLQRELDERAVMDRLLAPDSPFMCAVAEIQARMDREAAEAQA